MTYLDGIDLHAVGAIGRIHSVLKRVKRERGSLADVPETADPVHDELVKILTEAYEAGLGDGREASNEVGLGDFGTDPGDSAALFELRQIIDNELGWPNPRDETFGDYAARLRQIARQLQGQPK